MDLHQPSLSQRMQLIQSRETGPFLGRRVGEKPWVRPPLEGSLLLVHAKPTGNQQEQTKPKPNRNRRQTNNKPTKPHREKGICS